MHHGLCQQLRETIIEVVNWITIKDCHNMIKTNTVCWTQVGTKTISRKHYKLTCLERVEQEIQRLLLVLYRTPQLPLLHRKKKNLNQHQHYKIFIVQCMFFFFFNSLEPSVHSTTKEDALFSDWNSCKLIDKVMAWNCNFLPHFSLMNQRCISIKWFILAPRVNVHVLNPMETARC